MLKTRFSGGFCVAQESRRIKHGVHVTACRRAASAASISLFYYGYLTILLRCIAIAEQKRHKGKPNTQDTYSTLHNGTRSVEYDEP